MPLLTPQERIGQRINNRYRIQSILAEGGMGVLFNGFDENRGCEVAIKILRIVDADDKRHSPRLIREAETMVKLGHPNIVQILDAGEIENGIPFVVMELLNGNSLAQELVQRERLEPEEALAIALPVIGALAIAHDNGVVHRDLKPSNIFLCRSETGEVTPKLLDFGVAKVQDGSHETRSGTVLGTPEYMAPEQAAGGEVSPAIDIWAMGIVLYRCLSGVLPFEATTPMGVLLKVVNDPAPPLDLVAPSHVGKKICLAIDRALNPDPAHRYSNMNEFARALLTTGQAEKIALPSDPDPIGLPEWSAWLSDRPPERNTTVEIETIPTTKQSISKSEFNVEGSKPNDCFSSENDDAASPVKSSRFITRGLFIALVIIVALLLLPSRKEQPEEKNDTASSHKRIVSPDASNASSPKMSEPSVPLNQSAMVSGGTKNVHLPDASPPDDSSGKIVEPIVDRKHDKNKKKLHKRLSGKSHSPAQSPLPQPSAAAEPPQRMATGRDKTEIFLQYEE